MFPATDLSDLEDIQYIVDYLPYAKYTERCLDILGVERSQKTHKHLEEFI